MSPPQKKAFNFSPSTRYFLATLAIVGVLAILAWAVCIPFLYQSTSIWYKIGTDRILLRSGKVIGLVAATLLFLQIIFIAHLTIVESIFSPGTLNRIHKINAGVIASLALLHPLFVFAPEDISNIAIEKRYLPEGIGALLLVLIWVIFTTAKYRSFLDFSYNKWKVFHRFAALSAVILLVVHVLNVSDTFSVGPPKLYVIGAAAMHVMLWVWIQIKKTIR